MFYLPGSTGSKGDDVGTTCRVCRHEDRDRIDELLVGGQTLREIGSRFGLSKDTLFRHSKSHLPASVVALVDHREGERGDDLLSEVRSLLTEVRMILDKAKASNRSGRGSCPRSGSPGPTI